MVRYYLTLFKTFPEGLGSYFAVMKPIWLVDHEGTTRNGHELIHRVLYLYSTALDGPEKQIPVKPDLICDFMIAGGFGHEYAIHA